MAQINAAVAIILEQPGPKVHISLRQKFQSYRDYWEFPGGKLENNESFIDCVKREAYEEVGIIIQSVKPYMAKKYINKDNIGVNLEFFIVEAYKGVPYPKENQQLELVNVFELNNFKFLPASLEIIKKLQLDYL